MSINSVVLSGRLGSDPDVKYFDSSKVKASFTIAVDNPYKKDEPDWVSIIAWGKTAETIANYARKGHMIGIVGRLETQSWDDRNTGEKKSRLVANADRVNLMTSKREAEAMAAQQYQQPQSQPTPQPQQYQQQSPQYTQPVAPTYTVPAGDTGDIPF